MVESNEMKALKYSESGILKHSITAGSVAGIQTPLTSKASIASYHPFLDLSYLLSLQYPPLL